MHAQTKLSAARLWAAKKVPYFCTALLSLIYREVPLGTLPSDGSGTLAMTARGVLLYEVAAVDRWKVEELGSVIVHELMHFLRKHNERRMGRTDDAWAIAVDCEINDDLHAMKLPLPDGGGVFPSKFKMPDGRMAEEYYALLLQQQPPPNPKKCGSGQCGGCSGVPIPGEDGPGGADGDGRSDAEQQVIRIQTAGAIQQHVQQHGIGSVPVDLQRWAEDIVKPPKVPWEQKLAHCVRGAMSYARGLIESTYQKISRRQAGLGYGVGRPVMSSPVGRHPRVFVAIDTSGSMGDEEIARGVSETVSIVEAVGGEVTLLACDCAVHTTEKVKSLDDIKRALKGGGGTDFYPIFEAIDDMPVKPDLLVLITDGGGYGPAAGPDDYQVIWLLVGQHRCAPMLRGGGVITWGEHIEIDE